MCPVLFARVYKFLSHLVFNSEWSRSVQGIYRGGQGYGNLPEGKFVHARGQRGVTARGVRESMQNFSVQVCARPSGPGVREGIESTSGLFKI